MVGIIMLNYNNWKETVYSVESIIHNCYIKYRIYIIDNGSNNDSFDILFKKYNNNSKIELIKSNINMGYAAGNNIGIRKAIKDDIRYCIITNNDVLFKKNTIENLYNFITEKADAVIVGPKILDKDGNLQHSSRLNKIRRIDACEIGRFFKQRKLDEEHLQNPRKVYSVSGSCFIININKFIEINAFDEGTFLYNEENILGEQINNSQYYVYFFPNAEIVHIHGASTGKSNFFVFEEYIKSFLYYWKKYREANKISIFLIYYIYLLKIVLKTFWIKELRQGNKPFIKNTQNYLKALYNSESEH